MAYRFRSQLLFFTLVLALLLAACQGKSLSPASSPLPSGSATLTPTSVRLISATPEPSPTATLAPINLDKGLLKGVEVTLWHTWSGKTRQALDSLIKDFNQNNEWGIRVNAVTMGDSTTLYDHLESELAHSDENVLPNLILAAPEQIASLNDQAGIISNLLPYIADAQYGLSQEERSAIPEAFWRQDASLLSYQSGLPAQRDLHVLFYNRSWAKELGFPEPPTTPEAFRQQACAAAKTLTSKKDIGGTGGWIVNTQPETVLSWMVAFGNQEMPNRPTQPYRFNTSTNVQMVNFLTDLFNSSCAWNSRVATPYEYFANRQTLFYSGTLQDIAVQNKINVHLSVGDDWVVIPYPTLEQKPVLITSGLSYGILHSSDTSDLAAWLLARWLNQSANQNTLSSASGMLPTSNTALSQMDYYQSIYPQWKEAAGWLNNMQTTPGIGSWQAARDVVSDAGWMVFHPKPTPDSPTTFLDQLDKTVYDVMLHRP